MKRNPWKILVLFGFAVFIFGVFMMGATLIGLVKNRSTPRVEGPSVLVLDLEGVIMQSKGFIKKLQKYRKEDGIKAIVLRVNSPGGAVGPSQEIFYELKRTREEFNKPVVVSIESLAASGGYYAAVAGNKIVALPGAMLGSIGVIMEFANLRQLYDWAKIQRYNIKSGKFKDIGTETRAMTDDERELLQDMITDVHGQFKQAVADGRNMSIDEVNKYADGRIFTGAAAVKYGLIDQIGTFQDALNIAGELSGLGKNPKVLDLPRYKPSILNLLLGSPEEDENIGYGSKGTLEGKLDHMLNQVFKLPLYGQPLYLYNATYMPPNQ